jgi:hypothetical protein
MLNPNVPMLGEPAGTFNAFEGPQIRLLVCAVCGTIEELPDYAGPPESDTLLNISVEKHRFPSGDEHKGALLKVPVSAWQRDDVRKQIIEKIKGGGSKGLAEVDSAYYETRSTFGADALTCFKAHLRPQNGCPDYGNESKALRPTSTAQERKDLGLAPVEKTGGPKIFLCQFCPVHVQVTTKARDKAGLYK